jgi:CO dehydrogenase nickel-insertion accessory protein CooC1
MTAERSLGGLRIGVFGRGGAGKSTFVVLLGRALVRAGYTVCVLDADSTNVGLHRALGITRMPEPLIDYFGGMVFSGGKVTCPVDDPALLARGGIDVSQMPARYYGRADSALFFFAAGKLAGAGVGAGCDGPLAKIARDVRFSIGEGTPVTIIDFKAGFEDTARGVITGIHWAVAVLDPTFASLEFAGHMQAMEMDLRAGKLPATSHLESVELVATANRLVREAPLRGILFVLNKVQDERMTSYLRDSLAGKGITPTAVLSSDVNIARAWLEGVAMEAGPASAEIDRFVIELEKRATGERAASLPNG